MTNGGFSMGYWGSVMPLYLLALATGAWLTLFLLVLGRNRHPPIRFKTYSLLTFTLVSVVYCLAGLGVMAIIVGYTDTEATKQQMAVHFILGLAVNMLTCLAIIELLRRKGSWP